MAVAGDIVIELKLDDSNMTVNVKKAGTTLQEFQGTMNRTAASANSLGSAADSMGTRFRHLVVMLGNLRFVAMDLHDVFVRLPMAILKTSGELERLTALLGGLSTATTKAAKDAEASANFDYIMRMAQRAPFSISALSDAFVKFKSAGLDPTNGSLQALADGVAKFGGTGETMKRASIAIQQMAGKGVVSMEELRQQLGEAVPTAMKSMAIGMGLSMADLTKLVSKGVVEANDAIAKMLVMMRQDSEGAAAEMMKTWTGMQEQLKTKMELAAKNIAEAGFSDAVKKVVSDIMAGMDTPEFRKFTDQFGRELADSVRTIASWGRTLIEHAEAVKLVAEAWLIYKVAAAGIGPVVMGTWEQMKATNQELRNQRAVANMVAAQEKADGLAKIQTAAEVARAQLASSAASIQALQNELAFRQAMTAQMQAEMTRLNNKLMAGGRVRDDNGRFISRQAVQDQINDLSRLEARHQQAGTAIRDELARQQIVHNDSARKVMEHGNAADHLAATSGKAAAGISIMGTAATMATRAFEALGGMTTVINVLISASIYMWLNWGKTAEEAVARVERARKGLSDVGDLKGLKEDAARVQRELNAAQGELEFMDERNFDKTSKRYLAKKAEVARLEEEARKIDTAISQAKVTVARNNASEESRNMVRIAEEELQNIKDAKTRRLVAVNQAFEEELKAAGDNKAKQTALYEKLKGDRFKIEIETGKQTVDTLKRQLADLTKKFNGPEGTAAVQAAEVLTKKIEDAQAALNMAINASGKNKIIPKEDKSHHPEAIDKIAKMIGDVTEQKVQLEDQIASINSVYGFLDKTVGIRDKVMQKWVDGDFKYQEWVRTANNEWKQVTRDANERQIERLIEAMTGLERDKLVLEEKKKVADFARSLKPALDEARAIIADPLGASARGTREKSLDQMLSGLDPKTVEERLKSLGTSLKQLRSDAQEIDVADAFKRLAEETQTMNASMVDDHRNATRARMEATNQEFKNRMQKMIELRKANGATETEISRLQQILDANMAARNMTVAKKTETPMQKMLIEWREATKNMEQATARWGQSTIDTFVNAAKTGKLEWRNLTTEILADILKIQLQKQIGAAVGGTMEGLGNWVGSLLKFADGGIMTSMGSVPLKKYAAGGIANSPQMAMFGEGSTPEAYVPLPDGRRIPVAMQGNAGGSNVVVNVINQSGTPVGATQAAPRFDGKQMILDVVLTAAYQPGPFRDGMKGAMK